MPKMLPYTIGKESSEDFCHYHIDGGEATSRFELIINRSAPFNVSIFDTEFGNGSNSAYQTFIPEDVAFTISTLILAQMTKGQ